LKSLLIYVVSNIFYSHTFFIFRNNEQPTVTLAKLIYELSHYIMLLAEAASNQDQQSNSDARVETENMQMRKIRWRPKNTRKRRASVFSPPVVLCTKNPPVVLCTKNPKRASAFLKRPKKAEKGRGGPLGEKARKKAAEKFKFFGYFSAGIY